MKTGLVVIHYNDINSINDLIYNILIYKILDKIVIVDNCSRDDIKKELKKLESSRVNIIFNDENFGFSKAINIGCKYLIDKLGECNIFISNSDIIIKSEKDLEKLIVYSDYESIGIVAPTVIERDSLNRGWKNPTPILDSLMNLILIHRFIRKKYIFYGNEHYSGNYSLVDVVSGCFFLIKSTVLEKIDFLDEGTFLYYEENILAKKIHNISLNVLVANDVSIVHNHSVSIDKNLKKIQKLKLQKKSQCYFHSKYNDANIIEIFILKLTAFISRFILGIIYFCKDMVGKKYK